MGYLDDLLEEDKKKKKAASGSVSSPTPKAGGSNLDFLLQNGIKEQTPESKPSQVAADEVKKKNIFTQASDFVSKAVTTITSAFKPKVEQAKTSFIDAFQTKKKEATDLLTGKISYGDLHKLSTAPTLQKRLDEIKTTQNDRLATGKGSSKSLEKEQQEIESALNSGNDPISIIKRNAEFLKVSNERTKRNVAAGAIDTGKSLVDAVSWANELQTQAIEKNPLTPQIVKDFQRKKADIIGGFSQKASEKIGQWAEAIRPDNPDFTDQIAQGAGSALTFFIPGMGVSKGASVFAKVSPRLALLFGNIASSALESASEAGTVYEQNLKEGKSKEEASKDAAKTFWANSVLISVTNRLGLYGENAAGIKKLLFSAPSEGFQEFAQQAISNINSDRPWDEGALESGIIGGIIGGGLSFVDIAPGDEAKIVGKVAEKESTLFGGSAEGQPEKPVETQELGEDVKVYRGAKDQTIDTTRENGVTGGVSFSTEKSVADNFAKKEGGTVVEYSISKDAKVVDHSVLEQAVQELPKEERPAAIKQLIKENNIDVVRFDIPEGAKGESELRVINPDVLVTPQTQEVKVKKVTPKVMDTDQLIKLIDRKGFRTEEQIAALKADIMKQGIKYPVELTENEDGTFRVYDGNHRIEIAKDLGIKSIPVKVVGKQESPQITATKEGQSPTPEEVSPKSKKQAQKEGSPTDKKRKITVKETQKVAQKPVKVPEGEVKKSRAVSRIIEKLQEVNKNDANYKELNLAEDAARAFEFTRQNPDKAIRIAKGLEAPPVDITDTAISLAAAERAREDKNFKLQADLEIARSLRQTRRGQEIVAEKGRVGQNSSAEFIRQLFKARLDLIAKKKGWVYEKGVVSKVSKAKLVNDAIDTEVQNLKTEVEKATLSKIESAQSIIDKLTCV